MAQSTTNSVEAWYKNLNAKAVVKHQNLAKLVDLIQKEQIFTELKWINY
jgi:peptidyl-tRNA hydrolase